MACRHAVVVFAALVTLASCNERLRAGLEDSASLIQRAVRRDDNSTDVNVTQWLEGFHTVLRPLKMSEDPLIKVCCDAVRRLRVIPRTSMGRATENEQKWWVGRECNLHVGADTTEDLDGTPYCRRGLDSMPTPKSALPFTGQSGCTEEDRRGINASHLEGSYFHKAPKGCAANEIAENSRINWAAHGVCVQHMFAVSAACGACYADLFKAVASPDDLAKGCAASCKSLKECESQEDCEEQIQECMACIQPSVSTHSECVGGPVMKPFTLQDILVQVFHVPTN